MEATQWQNEVGGRVSIQNSILPRGRDGFETAGHGTHEHGLDNRSGIWDLG